MRRLVEAPGRTTRGLGPPASIRRESFVVNGRIRYVYIANLSLVVENESSDQLKVNGKIHLVNCMWVVTEDEKM